MSRYPHIIFDLGNVVLNVNFDDCLRVWSRHTGLSVEDFKARFTHDEAYSQHERNEISGHEYYRHLCKVFQVSMPYEVFKEGWDAILGETIEETRAFIHEFKGKIKFYAFTNSNALHREVWSQKYKPVLDHLDEIFCSSQIGSRKPEAKGFQFILKKISAKPSEVVFVDDLLVNVQAAEALGIKTVHFTDPKASIQELRKLCS